MQAEVKAKDAEIDRQQRELQTLRVGKQTFSAMYEDMHNDHTHMIVLWC